MRTYETFHSTYPGYGWFLPWYFAMNDTMTPTNDWENRVPSLDNGQLFWGAYAVLYRLKTSHPNAPFNLISRMQTMIDGMIRYAPTLFYDGNGRIRAVTHMDDMYKPPEQNKYYLENC